MSKIITNIFQSGIDNICMSIEISDEAKNKIQSYLETQINWYEKYRGDGVDGDINVQMPYDGDSCIYITGIPDDDLILKNDDNYFEFWEYIHEITKEAEPWYKNFVTEKKIDENISESQIELAEKIADILNEKLSYRHKKIAMVAWYASYTDGSINMQITYKLEKEKADKFIDMARDLKRLAEEKSHE